MEVIVDGSYGWPVAREESTLGEVFDQVRRQVEGKSRVVVALVLDGESLNRAKQEELKGAAVHGRGLLEVKTVDPVRLSGDTVSLLLPYLAGLERLHEEGAAFLAREELTGALQKLAQCMDGWDVLTHAVRDVAHLTDIDFTAIPHGNGTLEDRLRRLSAALVRFRAAIELKEAERLSAIVEKELRVQLQEWRGVLETLQARLVRRDRG
ncbi:MAG: hypothetical protein HYY17_16145 [Planctomycetes bacterium]|nr:hypothetical protein [Planctomycetota bacterium]